MRTRCGGACPSAHGCPERRLGPCRREHSTGPSFSKYNTALRGAGGKDARFVKKFEELCCGNAYVTTLHCCNSAVVKLSKLMPAAKVYRGISGGLLPPQFWDANPDGVRGGVEKGFTSTTRDRSVALHYASGGAAGTLFEISMGLIDRGADLSSI